MNKLFFILIVNFFLISCQSSKLVKIEHVTRDLAYEVKLVDGAPAIHATNPIITVVPYVLMKPGKHVITLKAINKSFDFRVIEVIVESDKKYCIISFNNYYMLVPEY